MTQVEKFIAAVEAKTGRPGRRVGKNVRLLCPAHDDRKPSLDVAEGSDGKALVICRAGCTYPEVCDAIGWSSIRRGDSDWTPAGPAVATYDYTDERGVLLYQVLRTADKQFRQRRPDATTKSGWRWSLGRVRRVLYRLPEVVAAGASGEVVYVCEGEKDADAIRALGAVATCNPGGAGKWRSEYTHTLTRARVIVVADNDAPGLRHAESVCRALASEGIAVSAVTPAVGKDAFDHLAAGHTLEDLVPIASDALATRTAEELTNASPIDGEQLVRQLAETLCRYVVLDPHEAVALALWVLHTHSIDAADITPYIAITSAEKRSGKTRLLELLERLVRNPWLTGRVTAAVLARKIDAEQPTLLLDEGDATFQRGSELGETLRGILNSGFRRSGRSSVNVAAGANDWKPADFSTFCPKAIAGIGLLPDTVMDRSVRIDLRRKLPDERVERVRERYVEQVCQPLRQSAAAWAARNLGALTGAEPSLPDALDDRAQDIWEPLLGIADLVGGVWPEAAREAAVELSASREDEPSSRLRLLEDIWTVFDANEGSDKLPSSLVIQELVVLEEAPWGIWFGRSIKQQEISKLLKPFGIKTKEIWFNGEKRRGWSRDQFEDAWSRYLPRSAVGLVDAVDAESDGRAAPTGPTGPTTPPKSPVDAMNAAQIAEQIQLIFETTVLPSGEEAQRRVLRNYYEMGGDRLQRKGKDG